MGRLTIAIAQGNPKVGDLGANAQRVLEFQGRARAEGADLLVLSELFLSGYPPEDLVLRPSFLRACHRWVERLAHATIGGPALLLPVPWCLESGGLPFNGALLLDGGEVKARWVKQNLPNYGVFDEKRLFQPGDGGEVFEFLGVRLGVAICEDVWVPEVCWALAEGGAELIISPNASPFERGKSLVRQGIVAQRVEETGAAIVYCNQVGGQDDLVFDGGSWVCDGLGRSVLALGRFREDFACVTFERSTKVFSIASQIVTEKEGEGSVWEEVWRACVLGLGDYALKNGFSKVLVGLSGGIDSAVVAAMAVDALGSSAVRAVMLPYAYTSAQSVEDARVCAKNLGISFEEMPVFGPVDAFLNLFDAPGDVVRQNLQARVRGTLLMALSNETGALLLTTGNKSELSVGYATLYGDMNGGFNPIKDVYKTEVYALAEYRNAARPPGVLGPLGEVIPLSILQRAPSAELAPGQRDEDTLPVYEVLDAILHGLIDEGLSCAELVARGQAPDVVRRVFSLVMGAEYKRRQSAPGVKIGPCAYGRERRYPMTHGYGAEEDV